MKRLLTFAVAIIMVLAFLAIPPAEAHHRPNHAGGPGTTTTTAVPPTTTTTPPPTTTTTTPPPTTTTTTPGGGLPPGVTLRPIDGGPNYYGQFSDPLPDDPSYFPIGVWGSYNHTQANRDLDASAGINTYLWVADSVFMPEIRADGRFRVIQDYGNQANVGTETAGWLLGDEWDMTGESCPSALDAAKATLPADGKFHYSNYGKGLALPPGDPVGTNDNWWAGAAEQNCWANGVDVASNDMYWFTDPYQGVFCCGWRYGNNITNLRNADASDGQRHPNWAFVEVGRPFRDAEGFVPASISPAQIRSAAWHSLIAGARGLLYFQHSFGGPCTGHHHELRSNCSGNRPAVTTLNSQIRQLAPVLNSPFADGFVTTSGGVRTMVKQGPDGAWYLFAGSTGGATSVTFSVAAGTSAEVMFEGRTLPVTNGQFTDQFADVNAVHIYRLSSPLP